VARHDRWKTTIRDAARELGFDLCGFTPIVAPPHADFLRAWLDAGHHADMAYLQKGLPKRLDPRLILDGARSIVSLGYRYRPPALPSFDWQQELRGRIAAYAFGDDYHRTIEDKLEALAAVTRRLEAGIVVKRSVDVGAVMEREWAALGGVGWVGKNTNLLHTAEGSYFFLGELITNLEIEDDAPVADHCGTCTRCLDLCPTGALKPGYVLDARLCISYWTIEHRGTTPQALRRQIGSWIFGCDVCQEVCPWNDKVGRERDAAPLEALMPFLPDLLKLDDDTFRARYRRTAIWRVKRDGFVRNVAVVLGNTRNEAAVAPLASALVLDASALVRAHSAWALGNIGGKLARAALHRARRIEADAEVLREIEAASAACA